MLAPAFTSLTAYGDALRAWPGPPQKLRARMAEVYGVGKGEVLPTRGATHAIELVLRRAALRGFASAAGAGPSMARLAAIYGLDLVRSPQPDSGAAVVARPDQAGSLSADEATSLAARLAPALLVVDESLIEFEDMDSLASLTRRVPNLVVVRSLSFAYAAAGARCRRADRPGRPPRRTGGLPRAV